MNELTKDQAIALYRKQYKLSEAQMIVGFELYLQLSERYQKLLNSSFYSRQIENFWNMMFGEYGIREAIAFHSQHSAEKHEFNSGYSFADDIFREKLIAALKEMIPA